MLTLSSIVPEGQSGAWSVSHHVRKKGSYTALRRGDRTIMSDRPNEIASLEALRDHARGAVLISGLGLGLTIQALHEVNYRIERVTIVEKSLDVARLVWPSFQGDPRFELIVADALTWEPPAAVRYGAVWHDIWDTAIPKNLPEMRLLEARYADRSDWQDSWDWSAIREFEEYLQRKL